MSKRRLNTSGLLAPPSKKVKLLGINIDNSLRFVAHIKELCGTSIRNFMCLEVYNTWGTEVIVITRLRVNGQFFILSSNLAILYLLLLYASSLMKVGFFQVLSPFLSVFCLLLTFS